MIAAVPFATVWVASVTVGAKLVGFDGRRLVVPDDVCASTFTIRTDRETGRVIVADGRENIAGGRSVVLSTRPIEPSILNISEIAGDFNAADAGPYFGLR
jgi:hypothetical protein